MKQLRNMKNYEALFAPSGAWRLVSWFDERLLAKKIV
jgi:hypothetical protein